MRKAVNGYSTGAGRCHVRRQRPSQRTSKYVVFLSVAFKSFSCSTSKFAVVSRMLEMCVMSVSAVDHFYGIKYLSKSSVLRICLLIKGTQNWRYRKRESFQDSSVQN